MMSLLWLYWHWKFRNKYQKRKCHIAISFACTLFPSPYQGVVALVMIEFILLHVPMENIDSHYSFITLRCFGLVLCSKEMSASVAPAHVSISESLDSMVFYSTKYCRKWWYTSHGPLGRIHNLSNLPSNMIYSNR